MRNIGTAVALLAAITACDAPTAIEYITPPPPPLPTYGPPQALEGTLRVHDCHTRTDGSPLSCGPWLSRAEAGDSANLRYHIQFLGGTDFRGQPMSDTAARTFGYTLHSDDIRWEIISDLPPYTSFNGRGWVLHMPDVAALGFVTTSALEGYNSGVGTYSCNGTSYRAKQYRARIVITVMLGDKAHRWAPSDTIQVRAPGAAQRTAHCGYDPFAGQGLSWPWRTTPSWAH